MSVSTAAAGRTDSLVRLGKRRTPAEMRFNLAGELRLGRKNRPLAMISSRPCDARTRPPDTGWVPIHRGRHHTHIIIDRVRATPHDFTHQVRT